MEDDRAGAAQPEAEEPSAGRTEVRPARGRTFLPDVTGVQFSHSRRGYDRDQVDHYVERVSRIVVELEAMRSPDAVIERALADVGEETSAILRRARKAAEEIVTDAQDSAQQRTAQAEAQARQTAEQADSYSARVHADSEKLLGDARTQADKLLGDAHAKCEKLLGDARSQADGLVGQARSDADKLTTQATAAAQRSKSDADEYSDRVKGHLEGIAQERHDLIEDLRKLGDQFHRAADRALEQTPTHDHARDGAGGNGGAVPAQQPA